MILDKPAFHEFFHKIIFPEEEFLTLYSKDKRLKELNNISKINIFVGANNSGKSLLARSIISTAKLHPSFSESNKHIVKSIGQALYEDFENFLRDQSWDGIRFSYGGIQTNRKIERELQVKDSEIEDLRSYSHRIDQLIENMVVNTTHFAIHGSRLNAMEGAQKEIFKSFLDTMQLKKNEYVTKFTLPDTISRIYCPTMRTLRNYKSEKLLSKKTREEYGFEEGIEINNGQDLYNAFDELIRSDYENEQNKIAFEKFLSANFFDGQRIIIRPKKVNEEVAIKVGNETERPIYHLGEGLQSIITLTFPLFLYSEGIIVIEEPETFLHPGLQRKLMDIYANHPRSRDFLFILTTHSNHVLDAANFSDKMSVFTLQKRLDQSDSESQISTFEIANLSAGDKSALSLLGVSNTSVYLANCTIWVEGVTDMMYLRRYIECYVESEFVKSDKVEVYKKFKEGIHYAFIFSGGDNLIHFDFKDQSHLEHLKSQVIVRTLCGRAMVIVDDDHKKNERRKRKFFKDLGGRFYVLPVVEIENLLSNQVLEETVRSFPTCADLHLTESNRLDEKGYAQIRMGTYIEDYLLKGVRKTRRKKFKSPNSVQDTVTINSKFEFCSASLSHITYENMTESSKKVVKEIIEFILEHNSIL